MRRVPDVATDRHGLRCAQTTAVALAAAACSIASGQPIQLSDIEEGRGGFVIVGQAALDVSGQSVVIAGDVNGDGLADLIVGSPSSDPPAGRSAGRAHVVFGKPGTSAIDLSAVAAGIGGFVVNGECAYGATGENVSGAGDVNGDGLADLLIGASNSGPAGRTYVVFGKTSTAAVDLSAVAAGIGGFVIQGQCAGDRSGSRVAGAGDVDGDGIDDLIVGVRYADPPGGADAGRSYVVFGKTGIGAVELSAIAAGHGGFVINGEKAGDRSAMSVAGAGDVNRDGLADLIVGAMDADPGGRRSAGRAYVVFGRRETAPVDLSAIVAGVGGFVIDGAHRYDYIGNNVAGAGDVNGDGKADLVVQSGDGEFSSVPGRGFVVFGKADGAAVALSAVAAGVGGFQINGHAHSGWGGQMVASAGDVNGDGLADVIFGAYRNYIDGAMYVGQSYVLFGKTDTAAIELTDIGLGQGGFSIDGHRSYGFSGTSVAGGGDINGDGLDDLVVGEPERGNGYMFDPGRTYVIFGATTGAFAQTAVDQLGGDSDDTLRGTSAAETLVGGRGNDVLVGGGGADVLHGGAGDDRLVVGPSNVRALSEDFGAGGNVGQLARIDGGTGFDTIALAGGGIVLDLTRIAGQGGGTWSNASRIESIERIDLTGSGSNTLKGEVKDVQDMAGMNLINRGTQSKLGWTNGTYRFAATVRRHQLIVDGNAGDVVVSSPGTWTNVGTAFNNGITYIVYNSISGRSQVLVNEAVTRIGLPMAFDAYRIAGAEAR